jgi:hypothetical protein
MKQQLTAVEWLQMILIPTPYDEEDVEHNKRCWEQAKAMNKEHIISTWENGKKSTQCKSPICERKTGLGYYNKTFKQQE